MSLFVVTYAEDECVFLVDAPDEETAKKSWLEDREAEGCDDLQPDSVFATLVGPFNRFKVVDVTNAVFGNS